VGRLGQGIEAPPIDARRHQVVPRSLGSDLVGWGSTSRNLAHETSADLVNHTVGRNEVLLQLGTAADREAVAQRNSSAVRAFAVKGEGSGSERERTAAARPTNANPRLRGRG